MNIVCLVGRLTDEPEVRYTQGNEPLCIARYTLAVDRGTKDKDGNTVTDFIRCLAMGNNGEFANKYLHKGKRYGVTGRWQTGSYTKEDGTKVYTNECYVTRQDFADGKDDGGTVKKEEQRPEAPDDFMYVPESIQEELPFN